jgi:hypothetical protein
VTLLDLFAFGICFDLGFDLNPLYVAPSIAGFEGLSPKGCGKEAAR